MLFDLDLVITKTDGISSTFSGSTNNYSLVVTNNGPDSITGAIVRDIPGAGITCPPTNPVVISGSGVPTGSFTIANLTAVSGITLGILTAGAAQVLLGALRDARRRGARVSFDTNYRPRLWQGRSDAAQMFKAAAGIYLVHIPYRGSAPAFTDLIGGQTQAMFPGLAAAVPHIRSGRVRPLAVTGLARHPQFKDLPTLDESGYKGFDAQQWYGVVGPAGMPAAVVKTLNDALAQVLTAPDLREKLSVEAVEPTPMTPDKFGEYMRADIVRWTKLAKARNIQLDS